MEHMQKQHFSFNSRKGSSPSEVFLKILGLFFELKFLENFQSKTHKLILKSNSRNKNWIVDPFTQVKSTKHMAKNQFQMHILWFFFHADVKM